MNAFCDIGYCTEFNTRGAMIQDHYATDCTDHEPPCPTSYNSAEAYKCNEFILFFLAIYKKKFDNNDIKEKQTL